MRVAHVATSDLTLSKLLLNQLEQLSRAGYEVAGIAAPGHHAKELEAAGIPFFEIGMTRRLDPLGDLRAFVQLVRVFRRERFDIVHTHTPKGGLLGQYAAVFARVPVRVHTIHGLYFPARARSRRIFVWLERFTMLFSHHNFSQSPEDIPTAIEERISRPERLELLGNGIDLKRFDPDRFSEAERRSVRRELGLSDEHLVVGMVGRLVEEKGYLEAFEAVRLIRKKFPQARFIFVGGQENKPDAIQPGILESYGIADMARFLGHRDDVDRLYAAMDIFMLPSHREGFPRSVMEAASMAKPCVVTDIRGCRQTVEHGVNGLLVATRAPEALAAALEHLLRRPEERVRMGRAGREKALREFDETKVIEKVIAAYRRLVPRS